MSEESVLVLLPVCGARTEVSGESLYLSRLLFCSVFSSLRMFVLLSMYVAHCVAVSDRISCLSGQVTHTNTHTHTHNLRLTFLSGHFYRPPPTFTCRPSTLPSTRLSPVLSLLSLRPFPTHTFLHASYRPPFRAFSASFVSQRFCYFVSCSPRRLSIRAWVVLEDMLAFPAVSFIFNDAFVFVQLPCTTASPSKCGLEQRSLEVADGGLSDKMGQVANVQATMHG